MVTADATSTPHTLVIDTSALLCRYLGDRRSKLVSNTMERAANRVVTGLARTEVELGLHQSATGPDHLQRLRLAMQVDWDNFWEIPIDQRCLGAAADVGARFGLGVANALHLAAIERLGTPITLLTFDRQQIPAATAMGIEVYTVAPTSGSAKGLLG